MAYPGGSYAEYALAWDWTTFHIPESISFEGMPLLPTAAGWYTDHLPTEAATVPLAGYTAAVALFRHLQLPTPWNPAIKPTPFVVYGGSTAVGAYAIKLARNSNVHPIIAIAGKGTDYVKTIVDESKGDAVFDYGEGADEMISKIKKHLGASEYGPVLHGLDPGVGKSSQRVLNEIVKPNGAINLVMPSDTEIASATKTITSVGVVHNTDDGGHGADARDLGLVMSAWFSKALQAGTFRGHPFEVKPGGLQAVHQALKDLKDGKNSAVKYVFRIADTPGL
jgi:NADPH2:quinone reductase